MKIMGSGLIYTLWFKFFLSPEFYKGTGILKIYRVGKYFICVWVAQTDI